jgi:hypothetical protein
MRSKLLVRLRRSWVAALAFGAWGCVGPGPPPTPPGAHAAFDRHLAEIDPRYRFVFSDGERIFEGRMDGSEGDVLLDRGDVARSADVDISGSLQLSPDGRWLLVHYSSSDEEHPANRHLHHLLLLDVHSREVRHVAVPQDAQFGLDDGCCADQLGHWIAPDRFVVSLSHYPEGGGIRKRFLAYRLADLSAPRELDFGNVYPVIRQARGGRKLLWGRSDEPTSRWTIHVFEEAGFRLATADEKEEFLDLWIGGGRGADGPKKVVVEMHGTAEPLFDWDIERIRWDVELDGRLVRRTWSGPGTPSWDEDLELYVWGESGYPDPVTSYVMDAEGHYRRWQRGDFIAKVPRTGRRTW